MTDVVKYATKGTLRNLELKKVKNNQPDIAAFDFTSIKKAEHAARIIERKGSKLLVGLVGDSLLEVRTKKGACMTSGFAAGERAVRRQGTRNKEKFVSLAPIHSLDLAARSLAHVVSIDQSGE